MRQRDGVEAANGTPVANLLTVTTSDTAVQFLQRTTRDSCDDSMSIHAGMPHTRKGATFVRVVHNIQ